MKKLFLAIGSFFLLFVFSIGVVSAQQDREQKTVILGRDEVVDEDYFAFGDAIFISGRVNGDVYAFGGKVVVDGVVEGDVISGAGTVEIPGMVNGDVRVGTGQLTIDGQISGSLTAGAGAIVIDDDAKIGRSIVVGTGSFSHRGEIGRGAHIGAGDATLDGRIGSNVKAGVSQLMIGQSAVLGGNVDYWSETDAVVRDGAQVSGSTRKHIPVNREGEEKQSAAVVGGLWMVWTIASLISGILLGLVLLKLAPNFTNDVLLKYKNKPWSSIGIGLVTVILAPILFILLLVTLIGIPFALILLLTMIILFLFIKVFVALYIGRFIQDRFKLKRSDVMALISGLIVWAVLSHIPVIGGLLVFTATLATIGAVLTTKKEYFHKFSSKKLI